MKKILSFIAGVIVFTGIIYINANAESIPIRKIDSDNRGHYALLENDVLVKNVRPGGEYKNITPRTKSKVIAKNVSDFCATSVALSGRLTILFNDRTLEQENNHLEFEVVDTNVDQVLNSNTYLKKGTIYSLNNNYTYDNIKNFSMYMMRQYMHWIIMIVYLHV